MIPKLHYITEGDSAKIHLENLQNACTSGAELVLLNLDHLSDKKFLKYALEAREITSHFQTRLIIRNRYKVAKEIKADGVHLEKSNTSPSLLSKELFTWQTIGATANNLEECETLIKEEVDYLYLAPFQKKSSSENLDLALGLNGYTLILEALNTTTPILGYGEITLPEVTAILATGISGVAVDRAITANFNSTRDFNLLLNASSTQEQRHSFK
ncbi:thiamine-phosphate diphosphorylase [Mesonia phycicola]|uniref:Thiamine-phosphate diphosphorylase n=1 Tax=Mesonia phycicola TaxID=579105 RepID=A0A1M6BJW8_9FLAO|nr:thiamine phosphate synthase [Mesonia phycicola]SHI49022.1 thiamine-phosphate diphosphorylase [Mesonia phycicola]